MPVNVSSKQDLKNKILETVNLVGDTVGATLGPGGRPVLFTDDYGNIRISKDGVSVAKAMTSLEDPVKDKILQIIKTTSQKSVDIAGDGPQPLYSKVLTPDGWVEMGSLKAGDVVCGTEGSTQEVLGVFPKGDKEIVEITFSNGQVVECCEDHLWQVTTNTNVTKVLPVKELVENYVTPDTRGYNRYKYYVPTTKVSYSKKHLNLDPYLLGVLIGDGCLMDNGSIELSLGYKKKHILGKLVLPEGITFSTKDYPNKNYIRVKFKGENIIGRTLRDYLSDLGLTNSKSEDKFIPSDYLRSSLEERTSLLQGLLDTDGYITTRDLFEFSTISSRLFSDFVELCRSLDLSLYTKVHTRDNDPDSYSDRPIYRASQLKGYKNGLKITDIKYTGKLTEMQCIKVSNPNSLYITDGFTVTHNTTTATILTQAIINEGMKAIEAGSNVVEVQRGIQKSTAAVINALKAMAVDIVTEEQIKSVAKLSANGDEEVANLIASALDFAKEDGIVIIEESKSGESSLEFVEGMLIERGMVSPYFVTNEQKAETVYNNPYILLYDGVLHSANQLLSLLNFVADENKPILLFADSFEGEALSLLLVNKMKGSIKPVAVKSPEFGDRRLTYLEDIAVSTGAQVISSKKGLFPEKIKDWDTYLGSCRTITVTGRDTTIVDGKAKITVDDQGVEINPIEERLKDIKSQMESGKLSAFDKQVLQERISKLTGGVAIIHVGGKSEVEMKEKKDRVDDALHATKAALAEGVVPGGGMALINCEESLNKLTLPTKDQEVGREIVRQALFAPFKKILSNAGVRDYKGILARIRGGFTKVPHKLFGKEFYTLFSTKLVVPEFTTDSVWNGYNVKTEEFVNLQEAGVLDPAKVTRTALENAASVAATILTTTAAVYEIPTDKTYSAEEVKDMM